MKAKRLVIPLFFLILTACKEYSVKTLVNEDGSIIKTIEVISRNEITDYRKLTIPLDETWTIKQEKDSSEGIYKLTAEKTFKDVEDLNNKYGSPAGIVIEVNHAIRGSWFYTYHEYEEIIEAVNPFTALNVEDYLNDNEYNSLLSGERNDQLENKLESYLSKSMFEEFILKLKQELSNYGIDENRIAELRPELLNCIDSDDVTDCFINALSPLKINIPNESMSALIQNIVAGIEKKAEKLFELNGEYNYVFNMPGMILSTNAEAVKGSTVAWDFNGENFTYTDYRMFAESRVTNIVNIIITGIVAAILFGLLITSMLYKNRKN